MILDNRSPDYRHLNLKNPSDSCVNSVGPNQLTILLFAMLFSYVALSMVHFFKLIVYYMHQMMSYDLSMIIITDIKFSIY